MHQSTYAMNETQSAASSARRRVAKPASWSTAFDFWSWLIEPQLLCGSATSRAVSYSRSGIRCSFLMLTSPKPTCHSRVSAGPTHRAEGKRYRRLGSYERQSAIDCRNRHVVDRLHVEQVRSVRTLEPTKFADRIREQLPPAASELVRTARKLRGSRSLSSSDRATAARRRPDPCSRAEARPARWCRVAVGRDQCDAPIAQPPNKPNCDAPT